MKKKLFLITGTSRGIGEALVRQLLAEDTIIYSISRNSNPSLAVEAQVKGFELHEFNADLSQTDKIQRVIHDLVRRIDFDNAAEFTLINNAGTIHPIHSIGQPEVNEKIIRAITVNLIAATLITDTMVRETEHLSVPRRVVNLSSGAAYRPVQGWSTYCSAKAGLLMYARCLAKEQEDRANPVKVMSFAPGVVNTEMQAEIRSADPESFPEHRKFQDYKDQGQLLSPALVAEKLVEKIYDKDFGETIEVDVRDHL